MRTIKYTFATLVVGFVLLIFAGAAAGSTSYDLPWTNDMNQASYWNAALATDEYTVSCTKYENHNGHIPAEYDAAVTKKGSEVVRVYPDLRTTGAFEATHPQGSPPMSWVMKCKFTPVPTTTTTEVPPSTTTPPIDTTSTTLAPPTTVTTVPESSTTSPVTTIVVPETTTTLSPVTSTPTTSTQVTTVTTPEGPIGCSAGCEDSPTTVPAPTTVPTPEVTRELPSTGVNAGLVFAGIVLVLAGVAAIAASRR